MIIYMREHKFKIVYLSCGDLVINPFIYKINEDCYCYKYDHGYQKILKKTIWRFKK